MSEQYKDTWNKEQTCQMFWQETKEHTARLLRVYGSMPTLTLPECIEGLPLTEIGDHCFATTSRLIPEPFTENASCRALCGDYMEEIILPDSVTAIGRLAFYNCRNLRSLSVGGALVSVGGDVFMNAGKLHSLCIRSSAGVRTAARQMLAQLTHAVEVSFLWEGRTEAKLLFPEYIESYDEIAPAHIFGRNIEGEGFRARQSFVDGRLDFAAYDSIFAQACVDEHEQTLGQMAEDRLLYPYELSQSAEKQYQEYVRAHAKVLVLYAVKDRALDILQLLTEKELVPAEQLTEGIVECSRQGWAEGAAALLKWKQKRTAQKSRYTFDEF